MAIYFFESFQGLFNFEFWITGFDTSEDPIHLLYLNEGIEDGRQYDATFMNDFDGPDDFIQKFLFQEIFVLEHVPGNKLDNCNSTIG